jgi:chromosome segregation ATPase
MSADNDDSPLDSQQQTSGQTTQGSDQGDSAQARIDGLMRSLGHKETERHAAVERATALEAEIARLKQEAADRDAGYAVLEETITALPQGIRSGIASNSPRKEAPKPPNGMDELQRVWQQHLNEAQGR